MLSSSVNTMSIDQLINSLQAANFPQEDISRIVEFRIKADADLQARVKEAKIKADADLQARVKEAEIKAVADAASKNEVNPLLFFLILNLNHVTINYSR